MTNESCSVCIFYRSLKDEGAGLCRRFPPKDYGYPEVGSSYWCGEFKLKVVEDNLVE